MKYWLPLALGFVMAWAFQGTINSVQTLHEDHLQLLYTQHAQPLRGCQPCRQIEVYSMNEISTEKPLFLDRNPKSNGGTRL